LYSVVATPKGILKSVKVGDEEHQVWKRIETRLAKLKSSAPDTYGATNLLAALFDEYELYTKADVDRVLDAWRAARAVIAEGR